MCYTTWLSKLRQPLGVILLWTPALEFDVPEYPSLSPGFSVLVFIGPPSRSWELLVFYFFAVKPWLLELPVGR